jgi:hypothetical protein
MLNFAERMAVAQEPKNDDAASIHSGSSAFAAAAARLCCCHLLTASADDSCGESEQRKIKKAAKLGLDVKL